jgi:hypothetical protein
VTSEFGELLALVTTVAVPWLVHGHATRRSIQMHNTNVDGNKDSTHQSRGRAHQRVFLTIPDGRGQVSVGAPFSVSETCEHLLYTMSDPHSKFLSVAVWVLM